MGHDVRLGLPEAAARPCCTTMLGLSLTDLGGHLQVKLESRLL